MRGGCGTRGIAVCTENAETSVTVFDAGSFCGDVECFALDRNNFVSAYSSAVVPLSL